MPQVQQGKSVSSIAQANGMTIAQFLALNPQFASTGPNSYQGATNLIQPGQQYNIAPATPTTPPTGGNTGGTNTGGGSSSGNLSNPPPGGTWLGSVGGQQQYSVGGNVYKRNEHNIGTPQYYTDWSLVSGSGSSEPKLGDAYTDVNVDGPATPNSDYTAISDYYKNQANSTYDPEAIRKSVLDRFKEQIDATKAIYAQKLAEAKRQGLGRLGTGTAIQARGGLLGSDFGDAQTSEIGKTNAEIEGGVLAEQNAAIAAIMNQANSDATAEIEAKRQAKEQGATAYLKFLSEAETRKTDNLSKLGKLLLSQGITDLSKIDPTKLKDIASKYGVTTDDIKSSFSDAILAKQKAEAEAMKANPASVQEYEYAKNHDYKGTYNEYQNEDANRKALVARAGAARSGSGLTPYQEFQATQSLSKDLATKTASAREIQRQSANMQAAYDAYIKDPKIGLNGTSQAVITTFNKILDPTSVVRESEYARSPEGQSFIDQLYGKAQQISSGGAGLTPASLKQFVDLTKVFVDRANKSVKAEIDRANAIAKAYGIDPNLIGGATTYDYNSPDVPQAPTTARVRLPSGQVGTIPIANLQAALAAGAVQL